MKCLKCGGACIAEPCFDCGRWIELNRCLMCGELVDGRVLENRMRVVVAGSKRGSGPRFKFLMKVNRGV